MVLVGSVSAALAFIAAPPAPALTPVSGTLYPNKVTVEGQCSLADAQVDDRRRFWTVATIEPRRAHGGPRGGVELAPAILPRLEVMGDGVVDDFSAAPYPQGLAAPDDQGGCDITSLSADAEVSGTSLILNRPGPYILQQGDFQVHWALTPSENPDDPPSTPCADNDGEYHPFPSGNPPATVPDGSRWYAETFCNKVTVTPFNVSGDTGGCPVSGDMSQWPSAQYINQYDAGARLGLPIRFGSAGGNACGPSSLLMALVRTGAPVSQTLGDVYDNVMQRPRAAVVPEQQNAFDSARAVAYLMSLGFRQARVLALGTSSDAANVTNVGTLYQEVAQQRPVLVSTAFGTRRWGITGGGHMIAVVGIKNGNFVVLDPAGNFFGSPTSHYGAGKCGYGVTYPVGWMKASIVGRYILRIGAHSPQPRLAARSVSSTLGRSIAVTDTHPESADNARTFYLRDPQGRRAGWIDGAVVEEIPNSYVGKAPASWAAPATGDPDFDTAPADPPPTPRAIVVPDPQPGTTLQVSADSGAAWALTVDGWVDGTGAGHDELTGTGSGQDATVPSAALDGLAPAPAPVAMSIPAPTPAPLVTPALTRLAVSPRAFRAASSGASARGAAKRRTGARVTFRLNVRASVRFTVERRSGRRYARVPGSFTRSAKAGANAFTFTGRIARRRLRAAQYRLVAVPSAGGRSGRAARVGFRIAR